AETDGHEDRGGFAGVSAVHPEGRLNDRLRFAPLPPVSAETGGRGAKRKVLTPQADAEVRTYNGRNCRTRPPLRREPPWRSPLAVRPPAAATRSADRTLSRGRPSSVPRAGSSTASRGRPSSPVRRQCRDRWSHRPPCRAAASGSPPSWP